jgi:hypothetical protein
VEPRGVAEIEGHRKSERRYMLGVRKSTPLPPEENTRKDVGMVRRSGIVIFGINGGKALCVSVFAFN